MDPKYAHLTDELHVEISALAPPAEAHARIAYALAEVKKYLLPDTNDMIWQTQMRDIERGGEYNTSLIFYGKLDFHVISISVSNSAKKPSIGY